MIYTNFVGTRGGENRCLFSDAIMNPAAKNGGLWAPDVIPLFHEQLIEEMLTLSYKDLAFKILREFGIDLKDEVIQEAVSVYDSFDDTQNPVPVVGLTNDLSVSELWHGPTRAFKDMALQPFPKLVSVLAQDEANKYLVLAATSGDTGPAALAGFRDLPNTKVVCLYPDGGTSDVQKQQMVKESGENLKVIGVKGNFDDTQKALKEMIKSDSFNEAVKNAGYKLSAANSVNFGRIIFQIVYHFWSYFELVGKGKIDFGDEITVVIPSGNFGNGLAAFYAKLLGLPIGKIVLASNKNNVLTKFIKDGEYSVNRDFENTNSPAMDIRRPSNPERILFHMFGSDRTTELMENLENEGVFQLTKKEMDSIQEVFDADYASEEEIVLMIRDVSNDYSYTIDPHTATAFVSYRKLKIKGPCIISSTAEWTKFSETMSEAYGCDSTLEAIAEKVGTDIPKPITDLADKKVIHTDVIEIDEIEEYILNSI
ncbi:threonine synthase [bacterium]|nr:threonine synthase [bacterium]